MPEKLYKYRKFDSYEYSEKLLFDRELFFASADNFNDPFDCKVTPNYELGTKNEIMRKFLENVEYKFPSLSAKEQKILAKQTYLKNITTIKDPVLMAARTNHIINTGFGIFSLSEKKDNLLMWAHYADNHKGFCVEFNAEKLFEICKNYIWIEELILCKKVSYKEHFPIINPYESDYDVLQFTDWLITKSKDWEYEQEWRLIYANHPNEVVTFPDDIITGIYFGVRCAEEKMTNIIGKFNGKKHCPHFYKAKLKQKEFGLFFESL